MTFFIPLGFFRCLIPPSATPNYGSLKDANQNLFFRSLEVFFVFLITIGTLLILKNTVFKKKFCIQKKTSLVPLEGPPQILISRNQQYVIVLSTLVRAQCCTSAPLEPKDMKGIKWCIERSLLGGAKNYCCQYLKAPPQKDNRCNRCNICYLCHQFITFVPERFLVGKPWAN